MPTLTHSSCPAKNGRSRVVPLPSQAINLLQALLGNDKKTVAPELAGLKGLW